MELPNAELIAGLEAAVTAAPGNVPLRLHLVEHLIATGRGAEGLAHAEAILRAQPDHAQAHEMAAKAAASCGDPRAVAFARVAQALGSHPVHEAVTPHAAPAAFVHQPEAQPVAEATPPAAPTAPAAETEPAPTPSSVAERDDAPTSAPVVEEPDRDDDEPSEPPAPAEFSIDPQLIQHPTLTLRNVIGVTDVKARLETVVLNHLRSRGKNGNGNGNGLGRGGFLMFGPPGCGKGFFARVIAGEIGAAFLPVKLGRAMEWPGDPRQNIHRIFEAAREAAPCVLFLDEVDRAGQRPDAPDETDRGFVARLGTELDSAGANRGVFVFAGAVSPWGVDMALRGDGRLDKTLLVLPPDEPAREAILRFHLRETRLAGVDVGWIVQRTQHFSGDDLLLLCETARHLASADALGDDVAIGPGHVTRALREVRPTSPAWFSSVMDHAITANHGGMYDEVLSYIDENQLV